MQSSWYTLHVRGLNKDGQPTQLPLFPSVGMKLVHLLGRSEDAERQRKDKQNKLWPKIQDGVRPAWAPDLLRSGYCVVFSRDGFPKLATKLGLKNPRKLQEQQGGTPRKGPGGKRVLTFDDVWAVGVEPENRPIRFPPLSLDDEDWWLAMAGAKSLTDPFLAPGGARIVIGAQRLADIVAGMLATPGGYPRPLPVEDKPEDFSEFDNPLIPVNLQIKKLAKDGAGSETPRGPASSQGYGYGNGSGFATTKTFQY